MVLGGLSMTSSVAFEASLMLCEIDLNFNQKDRVKGIKERGVQCSKAVECEYCFSFSHDEIHAHGRSRQHLQPLQDAHFASTKKGIEPTEG